MSAHTYSTHLVVIRNNKDCQAGHIGTLRFAVSSEPVADIVFSRLSRNPLYPNKADAVIAVPEEWDIVSNESAVKIKSYRTDMPICFDGPEKTGRDLWLAISNGRFAVQINNELLREVLTGLTADVVMVNADPELLAYREKLRFISEGKIACCRRYYVDSAEPTSAPADWPHHIFIKTDFLNIVLADSVLPRSFADFVNRCSSHSLKLCTVNVAGVALDLETEYGLLNLCKAYLDCSSGCHSSVNGSRVHRDMSDTDAARLVGKVLLGKNVQLGSKAVIAGPAIICNNTSIGQAAVINSSIIGPNVSVPKNQLLFNQIVQGQQPNRNNPAQYKKHSFGQNLFSVLERRFQTDKEFKTWPRFSYARFFKPIADCIASLAVLILFAPVLPFIALAIKLNSPGPIFFKDKRQGCRGREFYCLKFRTMIVGADKIQDKLRVVNQIDGPQFKMGDDPRISTVGRFLRNTCIDEIPQFFNVLLGQMSIVGPRPSPKTENTMCPSWRYARLSVRPGITGLWQVYRTREPTKDFQEWIYYDTKYIRNLSLKTDLWICWRTAMHLASSFFKQF